MQSPHPVLREEVQDCTCELCRPDSDEAFPDAEHLFQQAFAAEDPAPLLLHILKEHPTYFALRDLVSYYVEAVHKDPYQAQTLVSALVRIIHSPDAPFIEQKSLYELLALELGETHFKDSYDDDIYGPKNKYLLDSLLSGLSLKYNLSSSPNMYGFIREGLNAPSGSKDSFSELLVVGTCIQVMLCSSKINPGVHRRQAENVAKKLKVHETAETVKDPHAIEVLKLTIRHAETGLLQENERDDIWSLLFPMNMT